jgi:hypothetical protein
VEVGVELLRVQGQGLDGVGEADREDLVATEGVEVQGEAALVTEEGDGVVTQALEDAVVDSEARRPNRELTSPGNHGLMFLTSCTTRSTLFERSTCIGMD